jgi:hypothetical protein
MTFRQAVDAVLNRVGQSRTAINLDWQTVLALVSDARRELAVKTGAFKEMAYQQRFNIVGGQFGDQLPVDFIQPIKVMLKIDADLEFQEARRIDVKEWWTVTNRVRPHSYNQATTLFPVYMIFGPTVQSDMQWNQLRPFIYTAPWTPNPVSGFMIYQASYTDLVAETQTLNVPAEFEEVLINLAVSKAFFKIGEQQRGTKAYEEFLASYAGIRQGDTASKVTQAIDIRTLPEPQPSEVPTVANQNRR